MSNYPESDKLRTDALVSIIEPKIKEYYKNENHIIKLNIVYNICEILLADGYIEKLELAPLCVENVVHLIKDIDSVFYKFDRVFYHAKKLVILLFMVELLIMHGFIQNTLIFN